MAQPNTMKRPGSSYIMWLNENREIIKNHHFPKDEKGSRYFPIGHENYPQIISGKNLVMEVSKKAGEIWRSMTPEAKRSFEDASKAAMSEYKIAKAAEELRVAQATEEHRAALVAKQALGLGHLLVAGLDAESAGVCDREDEVTETRTVRRRELSEIISRLDLAIKALTLSTPPPKQDNHLIRGTIRHSKKKLPTDWTGLYTFNTQTHKMTILYETTSFKSPSGFASQHYKVACSNGTRKTAACNGWNECEIFLDGNWIKASSLRDRYPLPAKEPMVSKMAPASPKASVYVVESDSEEEEIEVEMITINNKEYLFHEETGDIYNEDTEEIVGKFSNGQYNIFNQ